MEIEQALFTSTETGLVKGYHLVARSPGIGDDVAQELCRWAPTHSSLNSPNVDHWSLNCFPIGPELTAVTRTTYGQPEYSGRGGLQIATMMLILHQRQFATYANDAWTVARTALALGYLTLPATIDPHLPKLNLPDRALIRRSRGSTLHVKITAAVESLRRGKRVAVLGLADPLPGLESVVGQLTESQLARLSFTTGLVPSVQRPFQLHFMPSADIDGRNKLESMGVECIDASPTMAPVV